MFTRQGFKADPNNACLWLWISAVSRKSNSTAELTLMGMCRVVQYLFGGAQNCSWMCAVADISSKADRGDILIINDQKSSYHTPLTTKSNQSHTHKDAQWNHFTRLSSCFKNMQD